jgi:hypothetical protein
MFWNVFSTLNESQSGPDCRIDRYEFLSLNLKTTVIRKKSNSPKSENTVYLETMKVKVGQIVGLIGKSFCLSTRKRLLSENGLPKPLNLKTNCVYLDAYLTDSIVAQLKNDFANEKTNDLTQKMAVFQSTRKRIFSFQIEVLSPLNESQSGPDRRIDK